MMNSDSIYQVLNKLSIIQLKKLATEFQITLPKTTSKRTLVRFLIKPSLSGGARESLYSQANKLEAYLLQYGDQPIEKILADLDELGLNYKFSSKEWYDMLMSAPREGEARFEELPKFVLLLDNMNLVTYTFDSLGKSELELDLELEYPILKQRESLYSRFSKLDAYLQQYDDQPMEKKLKDLNELGLKYNFSSKEWFDILIPLRKDNKEEPFKMLPKFLLSIFNNGLFTDNFKSINKWRLEALEEDYPPLAKITQPIIEKEHEERGICIAKLQRGNLSTGLYCNRIALIGSKYCLMHQKMSRHTPPILQ